MSGVSSIRAECRQLPPTFHMNPANSTRTKGQALACLLAGALVVSAPVGAHAQQVALAGSGPLSQSSFERLSVRPFAEFSDAATRLRDSLVALARNQVGRRYRLGGTNPRSGFDCSGLVRYVASALNITLPRTAAEQARVGLRVKTDAEELKPGDLLAFGDRRVSHVGIYVGDGKMVHASSVLGRVVETKVNPEVRAPLRTARRVVLAPVIPPAWLQ
jgi:cell wall-associated NlpC family hydrolase